MTQNMLPLLPLLVALFVTPPVHAAASLPTVAPAQVERPIVTTTRQPAFRHVGARLRHHVELPNASAPRHRRALRFHFRHGVR